MVFGHIIDYRNSDHIFEAEPATKNFWERWTRDITASKCRCLNRQPSGPVFLQPKSIDAFKMSKPIALREIYTLYRKALMKKKNCVIYNYVFACKAYL